MAPKDTNYDTTSETVRSGTSLDMQEAKTRALDMFSDLAPPSGDFWQSFYGVLQAIQSHQDVPTGCLIQWNGSGIVIAQNVLAAGLAGNAAGTVPSGGNYRNT